MGALSKVFLNPRMATILLLGFVAGIPLALTASTLQAWLTTEKIDLKLIGLLGLVGMPYALKFLWAPLFDRFDAPLGFSKLGRRRGWLFLVQLFLILSLVGMAFSNPTNHLFALSAMACLVSFFSASQDILIDAYKIELLKPVEFGAGSGMYNMGYRIAMIVSGAVALMMADHLPWKTVYLIMGGILVLAPLIVIFSPEPVNNEVRLKTLREAIVLPFLDFFRRRGAFEMLAFIVIYKLDVAMTVAMMTTFLLSLDFTKTEVAAVFKVFGMLATVAGTLVGGGVMIRLGIQMSLWIFGITQAIAGLSFLILAHLGHSYSMLVVAVSAENFFSGMGVAAFSAFLMSLCNKRFTATQYALLSSFMALTRYLASAPSGFLIEAVGWQTYFLICTLIGIPGLLLLTRYSKWNLSTQS